MQERGTTEPSALAGSLLLAHPSLRDHNFKRSVILISSHDANGALGVVLNRPLQKKLGDLTPDFALSPLASIPLFKGGPVETGQVLLCGWRKHDDGSGFQLMFGMEPEKAIELQSESDVQLRAFLGYSGWGGGQLEDELKRNTWLVSPLVSDLLDEVHDESLWKSILGGIGHEWKLLAEEPDDPELN